MPTDTQHCVYLVIHFIYFEVIRNECMKFIDYLNLTYIRLCLNSTLNLLLFHAVFYKPHSPHFRYMTKQRQLQSTQSILSSSASVLYLVSGDLTLSALHVSLKNISV